MARSLTELQWNMELLKNIHTVVTEADADLHIPVDDVPNS